MIPVAIMQSSGSNLQVRRSIFPVPKFLYSLIILFDFALALENIIQVSKE